MRFPKLKHAILCEIIVYTPALLWVILIPLALIFSDWVDALPAWIPIAVFLGTALLVLVYLFSHVLQLLTLDSLLMEIRGWKRDRLWFETRRNGSDPRSIERRILRRCRRYGKAVPITGNAEPSPICLRHRSRWSWWAHYSQYEQTIAVYSVSSLDSAGYRALLQDAQRRQIRILPDQKKKPSRDVKPPMRAMLVVILADAVPSDVPAIVRSKLAARNGACIPCVADRQTGRYYCCVQTIGYEPGMEPKPERNFAVAMVRRIVFGGWFPRGNVENRPEPKFDWSPETSLWTFLGETGNVVHTLLREDRSKTKRLRSEMKNGEIRMDGETISCRLDRRFADWAYDRSEEDPARLIVWESDFWDRPATREILPKDKAELRRRMEKWLRQKGLECTFRPLDEALDEPEETDEI